MTVLPSTPATSVTTPVVRRLPARDTEPPFDDEVGSGGYPPPWGQLGRQPELALSFAPSSGRHRRGPLQLVPQVADRQAGSGGGEASLALPEPRAFAARFVQALLEVLAGNRPAAQLARYASPEVYTGIEREATRQARRRVRHPGVAQPGAGSVRSIWVSRPTPEVAEISAVIRRGERSRALALRLEASRGRWQCTVWVLG